MNERLKELAEQAGAEFHANTIIVNGKDADDFVKKFAELVRQDERELAKSEQEPVAYADALDLAKDCNWDTFICKHSSENHEGTRFKIPLYTAPPRTKWVGLTDKEMESLVIQAREVPIEIPCDSFTTRLLKLAEAKLKEKKK